MKGDKTTQLTPKKSPLFPLISPSANLKLVIKGEWEQSHETNELRFPYLKT